MLNPELWITGLTTMVIGMGIVFIFLVIMVFAIMIMTKVVEYLNKVCPIAIPEVKTKKVSSSDDSEVALAIAVALQK